MIRESIPRRIWKHRGIRKEILVLLMRELISQTIIIVITGQQISKNHQDHSNKKFQEHLFLSHNYFSVDREL